jgi:hypothetical protein
MTDVLHWVIDAGWLVLSVVGGCWVAAFLGAAFIAPTEFDWDERDDAP